MNCEEYKSLIHELLDNEIQEKDREFLFEHIEFCESCKIYYLDLKKLQKISMNCKSLEPYKEWKKNIKSRKLLFVLSLSFLFITIFIWGISHFSLKDAGIANKTSIKENKAYILEQEPFEQNIYILETVDLEDRTH